MAQEVERVLGKDEVTGSNPVISSTQKCTNRCDLCIFSTDYAFFRILQTQKILKIKW
mgnify:CR=1 FL=1